jgi:hypothetical protein
MPTENPALFKKYAARLAKARPGKTRAAAVVCGNGETIADRVEWTTVAGLGKTLAGMPPEATLLIYPKP